MQEDNMISLHIYQQQLNFTELNKTYTYNLWSNFILLNIEGSLMLKEFLKVGNMFISKYPERKNINWYPFLQKDNSSTDAEIRCVILQLTCYLLGRY